MSFFEKLGFGGEKKEEYPRIEDMTDEELKALELEAPTSAVGQAASRELDARKEKLKEELE